MNVTIDVKEADRLLSTAIKEMPGIVQKAMDRTVANASNKLVDRTQSGEGVYGQMKPYTAQYAKYRQRSGRQTRFVDLNFTGRMMGSITPFISKIFGNRVEGEIRPARAEESKKVFYTNIQRKWWGLNNQERSVASADFSNHFNRLFRDKVR